MLLFITFISFILIFWSVQTVFTAVFSKKASLQRRLNEIAHADQLLPDEPSKSLKEKLLDSLGNFLENSLNKGSSMSRHDKLLRKLDSAGLSKTTTPARYMSGLILTSLLVPTLTFILLFALTLSFSKSAAISILTLLVLLYLQNFILVRRITRRKRQMVRDLPYTLDLILVSVEAGLSFDGAISKVVANIPGPISEEFAKTLKEIRMGIHRKAAMKNMSNRCNLKELSSLNTAIIQADELGVSLSNIIRIQAAALREDRKQQAREKALKAPVKILLPLILFIFPTIFIVILGPAMIQIMEIFK